jgi:site-specific DNA recombinase
VRAAIYARLSEDRDETQLGVGRQVQDCEALARARNWSIADRYIDNDISAYSNKRRPQWERLLADITAGQIDAVIVYHLDRLTRQPRDLERFFDTCDRAGVSAMATVSGDINLATDDGRFHARILGAVARKSSDDQSRRLMRKALELAQAGQVAGGGSRPYGFENDRITIRESEAVIIREMVDRLLAGETIRSLCLDLQHRKIPSVNGTTWKPFPLRRMLASARISGQREHKGEIIAKAVWEPIIPPEKTTRVRALLADPARRATRPPQRYVLKGLLRCWRCNAPLVARPSDTGQRRYGCIKGLGYAGCGGVYALGETVERFVTQAALVRLDGPEVLTALQATPSADVNAGRADQITGRLDELAQAYAAEVISMREWLAARNPLQQQLDQERRRVARETGASVLADIVGRGSELREQWDTLSIDRQRAILGAVLHQVTVLPARRGDNRFQPERFQLVWRH